MKRKTARETARAVAKHYEVKDGDLVVLKRNKDNLGENLEVFNALRNSFGLTGRKRCVIMIVDEFDDVTTLSEKDMFEYGWCKCGALWDTPVFDEEE